MEAAEVPEGLAAMPSGPGSSTALAGVDLPRVPNDRILQVLRAQYRQLCHEQARMAAVIAEVGRCEGFPDPGEVRRRVPLRSGTRRRRPARCCAGPAPRPKGEHDLPETIVHDMPVVFGAWLAGEIDRARVRVFERYLVGLTDVQVAGICGVAVPRAPRLTIGQLVVLLRRRTR